MLLEDGAERGDAGSGKAGNEAEAVADGVLGEYGNRVPFWGDDDDPALHAMRAGGRQLTVQLTVQQFWILHHGHQ